MASTSYDLYAVSNHIGSLVGGHYTAHCLTRTPQVCHTTAASHCLLLPACQCYCTQHLCLLQLAVCLKALGAGLGRDLVLLCCLPASVLPGSTVLQAG